MKIKPLQFTPRREEEILITPKVRTLILRIIIERAYYRLRCYTCDEKGHYEKDCPKNKFHSHKKKGNKRRHHAHATEDDEPSKKRSKYESEDSSSEGEYVLIFTLIGNITHGSDDWLIDSGASKHMTGFKESFLKLSEHMITSQGEARR